MTSASTDGRQIVSGRAAAPAPGSPLLLLMPSSTLVGSMHYILSVHDAGPPAPHAWRVPVCGVGAVNASSKDASDGTETPLHLSRKCRRDRRPNRSPQGSDDRFEVRPARSPSSAAARAPRPAPPGSASGLASARRRPSAEGVFDDVKQQIEMTPWPRGRRHVDDVDARERGCHRL